MTNIANDSVLKLANVSKFYNSSSQKVTALQDINLEIKKSQAYCLTGPSGSGKTTLLQIAGLLDSPSQGEVYINGINTTKENDKTKTKIRRENIGFIYQFHHLLPEFSALENVALPLLIQGLSKDEAHEKAKKILELVDMNSRLDHKPSELSGGQQQRAAICRAIVSNPSLILADEPTGNLDSKNSKIVFELLLNLVKEKNISCLIVTHNAQLSKKISNRLHIQDGILENIS